MAAPANRPVQSVASSSRSIGALCPKRTRPSSRPAARAPAANARPPSRAATGPRREGCPYHGRRSAGRAPRGSGRRRFPAPHAARARCGAGRPSAARARPALVPSGDRRRRVARISRGDSCVEWPWTPNLQRAASAREHRAPPPRHGPRRPSYGIPPSGAVWDVKETRVMLTSESRVWRRCAARVAVLAVAACGGSQQGLIGPGRAAKLAILVQPSAATAGAQITPAVQVAIQDASGRVVTTAANLVTLAIGSNPGGGALSGTPIGSPVNGVATFANLSIERAGNGYTLTASAPGLAGATSGAFAIAAGAATPLVFTVHPNNTRTGAVISPAVQVAIQDAFGNAVATATNLVTAALGNNPSGGTLSGTTTASPINGRATFSDLSVDKAGKGYTLAASATGLTDATSIAFNINPPLIFTTIAARGSGTGSHSCGVTTAGAIYCWGSNSRGQIGDNSGTDQYSPALVQAPAGVTFTAITTGFFHSCGLATSGAVYCWGDNGSGELGDNTSVAKPTPVQANAPAGVTFATLDAGYYHTCAVTPTGSAYCWGANGSGQLGDNTAIGKPVPTAVQGGLQFALVSGGADHTCGVTTTGIGYCWGFNGDGEIGDNTTLNSLTPKAIAGSLSLSIPAAGLGHSCAVTTGPSAMAYCWGFNGEGQLGDGTTTQRFVPTRTQQ